MTVCDWLPKDAFVGAAAKKVLAKPVADWSARWIAGAPAAVSRLRLAEGAARRDQSICGDHVELELSGTGKRHLLEALLDVDLAECQRSEADIRVLDAFAEEVCEDFVRTLDASIAAAAGPARLRLTVAIGRNDVFEAVVPASSLVPLLKQHFGTGIAKAQPLSRLSVALKHVPVRARAVLGHVELSLSDMRVLGVGDIVVVDRAVGDPVELRLPESRRPFARGKLGRDENRLSIQL
jgi:flagellar motor switch/type III secretory pathway protein FliN